MKFGLTLSGPLVLLATLPLALQPLHSHVAVWTWIALLAASVAASASASASASRSASATAPAGASARSTPLLQGAADAGGALLRGLQLWFVLALASCVISALMGLWHGDGLRTMRQDGKLAAMALMLWGIAAAWRHPPPGVRHPGGLDLRAMLMVALALQLMVAATVALAWPRSQLPMTAVPWATTVALTLAVVAPLGLEQARAGVRARSTALTLALGAAVLAGAIAVIASRSRAAWIILPWLLGLVVMASSRPGRSALMALLVGLFALGAGILYDSQQAVQVERGVRLLDLWQELQALESRDSADPGTSLGSRWLMWHAALDALMTHPWAGLGQEARIALVQQVIPPQAISGLPPLVHVHQQFLNQALDHGLPGLLAALLSAGGLVALAMRLPAGRLRQQISGVAVVHITGLMFNANMTHGPYAFAVAATVAAAVLLELLQPEGSDARLSALAPRNTPPLPGGPPSPGGPP